MVRATETVGYEGPSTTRTSLANQQEGQEKGANRIPSSVALASDVLGLNDVAETMTC